MYYKINYLFFYFFSLFINRIIINSIFGNNLLTYFSKSLYYFLNKKKLNKIYSMKTKLLMYVVFVVFTTLFLSSCSSRYERGSLLEDSGSIKFEWHRVVNDSIQKEMFNYFIILGKRASLSTHEVLIHRYFGLLDIPDSLVQYVPGYYTCFYRGKFVISERTSYRTSGPTLWKAPQTTFVVKVINPVSFDQGITSIVTRHATISLQVILVVLFLLFGFFAFFFANVYDSDEAGDLFGLVLFSLLCLLMLALIWFYTSYFVSVLLTIFLIVLIVLQIRFMIRQRRRENLT
jgi:hypothetical protein